MENPFVCNRSNVVCLSVAVLGIALLMLSCASSSQPDQLIVHVPDHFSGTLHIQTCVRGAPAGEITVDSQGLGKTVLCPASDHTVEIEVRASDRHFKLVRPEVQIRRTGDGLATSIEAQLPQ
jgi:hypothetical protein